MICMYVCIYIVEQIHHIQQIHEDQTHLGTISEGFVARLRSVCCSSSSSSRALWIHQAEPKETQQNYVFFQKKAERIRQIVYISLTRSSIFQSQVCWILIEDASLLKVLMISTLFDPDKEHYGQSRNYFEALIQQGAVRVNGQQRKKSFKKFSSGATWLSMASTSPSLPSSSKCIKQQWCLPSGNLTQLSY